MVLGAGVQGCQGATMLGVGCQLLGWLVCWDRCRVLGCGVLPPRGAVSEMLRCAVPGAGVPDGLCPRVGARCGVRGAGF